MLTTQVNPFAYDLQRISGIVPVSGSFSLSDHLSVDKKLLITLF